MKKIDDRGHEKRTKSAALTFRASHIVHSEELGEETLTEVGGFLGSMGAFANKCIDRHPVGLAEARQGRIRMRGRPIASGNDFGPQSSVKLGLAGGVSILIPQALWVSRRHLGERIERFSKSSNTKCLSQFRLA